MIFASICCPSDAGIDGNGLVEIWADEWVGGVEASRQTSKQMAEWMVH